MLPLDIAPLGGGMEAEMRAIAPLLTGLLALAAVSTQAVPSVNNENWHWRSLDPGLSFDLGDQGCGEGWHQALWRDWSDDWWWGPCVPDRSMGGWVVGFGMGYRRGVTDAIADDIVRADHRVNEE